MGEEATGRYRLGGRIGGGGMAEVYEATLVGAEGFARPVAVKRMLPQLSSDDSFGKMFVNEARIASLLHHANIAGVLDFDRDEQGRYFLVMELIRGVDLRALMDTGRLPVEVSVHIAAEMLRGLSYAHALEHDGRALGIVHRDISPHNVMLSWDGAVKLVDFGIAKAVAATGISRTGTIKGKLAYMSPEQAGALELDGRSDVFAVGVVLHELLTGERLFRGSTEPEVLARVLTQPIPRPGEIAPDVPPELDRVVMGMLERDREQRTASAHDALDALLATPVSSSRGGLELERTLAERFPGRGSRRASTGASSAGRTPPAAESGASPAVPQVGPLDPTMAARPGALGERASAGRGAGEATPAMPRPAAAVETLTAGPGPSRGPVSPAPARRVPWRAGALVVVLAAAATAGALLAAGGRGGDGRAGPVPTAGAMIDGGATGPAAAAAPPGPATVTPAPATVPPAPASEGEANAASAADAGAPGAATDRGSSTPDRTATRPRDAAPGVLSVVVSPWAEIRVNGKSHGQTPKAIQLAPGTYRVQLRNRELQKTESTRVRIQSGKTTRLDRSWN